MSKTVFVTGGTGFVGAHLLHLLVQKGYTIRALKRSTSRMDLVKHIADKVQWIDGDVLDIHVLGDVMPGCQEVYHCAAVVSFDPRDRKSMYDVNVEGTANVVNIALDEGVEKFCHVSSIAALGRKVTHPHVDEKTAWEKNKLSSHYAISKFKAETEAFRGQEEGLPTVVVNPSVILGSNYWDSGTGKFFGKVWNGLGYYPSGVTGFVDVRDVARAMVQLMESNVSGERFILNGENLSYKTLLNTIASYLNKKAPSREARKWMANLLWRLEALRSKVTGSRPLLTKETARNSAHKFYYQNEKIIEAIDFIFTPIEVTVKETALQFIQSQKDGSVCGSIS